jgi:hypothetical protein
VLSGNVVHACKKSELAISAAKCLRLNRGAAVQPGLFPFADIIGLTCKVLSEKVIIGKHPHSVVRYFSIEGAYPKAILSKADFKNLIKLDLSSAASTQTFQGLNAIPEPSVAKPVLSDCHCDNEETDWFAILQKLSMAEWVTPARVCVTPKPV